MGLVLKFFLSNASNKLAQTKALQEWLLNTNNTNTFPVNLSRKWNQKKILYCSEMAGLQKGLEFVNLILNVKKGNYASFARYRAINAERLGMYF